jgi:hypothetical protein
MYSPTLALSDPAFGRHMVFGRIRYCQC